MSFFRQLCVFAILLAAGTACPAENCKWAELNAGAFDLPHKDSFTMGCLQYTSQKTETSVFNSWGLIVAGGDIMGEKLTGVGFGYLRGKVLGKGSLKFIPAYGGAIIVFPELPLLIGQVNAQLRWDITPYSGIQAGPFLSLVLIKPFIGVQAGLVLGNLRGR